MEVRGKAVCILWNSEAGWNAADAQGLKVEAMLAEAGASVELHLVKHGGDIQRLALQSRHDHCRLVIAAGGDGTLNAVASTIINSDAALGVIPAGTLNHFARDLGIDLNYIHATRQMLSGREIQVDAGQVNGRVFINNSVLGFYPIYRAVRRSLEAKGWGDTALGRFLAVLGGMLRVFWRLPHLRLRLTTASQTIAVHSPFVLIANNEHELESGRIGKRQSMSSGKLWVYVMRRCSRWALLRYFFRYIAGRFSRADAFEEFSADEVTVESRRRKQIGVGIDGEVVHMRSPLQYRCLPGALRVIAPEDCPVA